jgi:hypothetical protein
MLVALRNKFSVLGFIFLLLTVASSRFAYADEPAYSVGLGFEFSSGTYGTNTRTDTILVPFTAAFYPTDNFGLTVEIPYVYQSNSNVISRLGSGMAMSSSSSVGRSGMMGDSSGSTTSGNVATGQGGVGDVIIKGGYVLVAEQGLLPQIRPSVFVKVPAADKNKALGTGEFDEEFAVEVSKRFGAWNLFAEAGYTLQGKSSQLHLRNFMAYDTGVAWQISDKFRPALFVKGSSSPADNSSGLMEVRMKIKYQVTQHTGIEGYLAKGLTRSSLDYGSGFAVYQDF